MHSQYKRSNKKTKPACYHITQSLLLYCLCGFIVHQSAHAKQIQVPADYPTIQAAIDAAEPLDTIIVAPGIYNERIEFKGKDLTLTSTDPTSAGVVARTIIDAEHKGRVISLQGSETEQCVITGLTITHGGNNESGGGIWGNGAKVTIQDNIIKDNESSVGGGLNHCQGLIRRNIISGNKSNSVVVGFGGGLNYCHGVIENNLIYYNESISHWPPRGGGLARCYGTIRNNVIYGNIADTGGGLSECTGTIINNIIGQNNNGEPQHGQLFWCSVPQYCAIQGWTGGGTGNITLDPLFVDAAGGDFRLQPGSPCIDAGGRVDLAEDFARTVRPLLGVSEPRGDGSRYDIGAYEFVSPVSAAHQFNLYR